MGNNNNTTMTINIRYHTNTLTWYLSIQKYPKTTPQFAYKSIPHRNTLKHTVYPRIPVLIPVLIPDSIPT